MVVFLATTIISCSDARNIIHRLSSVDGLTELQRTEIVQEIRKVIPTCPIKVVKDD